MDFKNTLLKNNFLNNSKFTLYYKSVEISILKKYKSIISIIIQPCLFFPFVFGLPLRSQKKKISPNFEGIQVRKFLKKLTSSHK